jgi:drug/metabolite transporter (DMT)-like permease
MLTPISFLQVPIVATAGYLLFDERLDAWIGVGAAVIFAANVYIAHREAQLARRAVTDSEIASEPPAPR